jgi:hypothetical protein
VVIVVEIKSIDLEGEKKSKYGEGAEAAMPSFLSRSDEMTRWRMAARRT